MGCNLPADMQVVTTYEVTWKAYLAVLMDGDQMAQARGFCRAAGSRTRCIRTRLIGRWP